MAKGMIQNGLRMKGGWMGNAPVKYAVVYDPIAQNAM
jgi:hypothetical protein